jgi:transcriptional regulator with XRE-family HTH domain
MNTNVDDAEKRIKTQMERIILRLKEEREKARISQMGLSFQAGLSQNLVNCIETGRRIPNLYTLLKICNALHINPASLFTHTDEDRQCAKKALINLIGEYI